MSDGELFGQLLEKLTASWTDQPDKPEENPVTTLRALWFLSFGDARSVQGIEDAALPALDQLSVRRLEEYVEMRISGVPLAYITGRQSFMGLELLAGREAIIPRLETEILGNAALTKLREMVWDRGRARVIDLCTGSGNLALALAHYEPNCVVFGVDLSPEAVSLAELNAERLGLGLRVRFQQGDLFGPYESQDFLGEMDLVTCNPPYISTARVETMPLEISGFEPRLAFDGGPFGVNILTRLIREAHRFLKPSSWLCFEVGLGQGKAIAQMLRANPHYRLVEPWSDERGEVRALLVQT